MKKLKIALLSTAFVWSSHAHSTGIPCVDIAVLGSNMQQLLTEEIGQLKELAQSKARMLLEEELNIDLTDYMANATAEQTARVTDAMAGVQEAEAIAVNIPPPSSCQMYNEAKNGKIASIKRAMVQKKQVTRFVDRSLNMGENALPENIKIKEEFAGTYGRFLNSMREGSTQLQLNPNNFFRTGEFDKNNITDEQAQARQDMLDVLTTVSIRQPFDHRKTADDFQESDLPAVMQHMKNVSRASLVRGSMVEIYSLYSQSDGQPSVAEIISKHNEERFLNPEWVAKISNTDPSMGEFIQPEAVMRETAHTNSYIAYMTELRFKLQQWQAAIAATRLAIELEKK
tara:strand:- start:10815 stop:11840 length:1026 start_codon:yes stop_codon:yes gene_type:complete